MTSLRTRSFIMISMLFIAAACSRKSVPAGNDVSKVETNTTAPRKVYSNYRIPRVIIVDDRKARRSVDGRYYYDLGGRRYWRNKRDGRYYLYNKSMFGDPDFAAGK